MEVREEVATGELMIIAVSSAVFTVFMPLQAQIWLQDMQTVHAGRLVNEGYQMVFIRKENLWAFSFSIEPALVCSVCRTFCCDLCFKIIIFL